MKTKKPLHKPLILFLLATTGVVIYLAWPAGLKDSEKVEKTGERSKMTADVSAAESDSRGARRSGISKEQQAEQLKAPEGMDLASLGAKPTMVKGRETLRLIAAPQSKPDVEGLKKGDRFEWSPVPGYQISGVVYSYVTKKDGYAYGIRLDDDKGRFVHRKNIERESAHVLFNGKQVAHKFISTDQGWDILESSVSQMFCTRANATYPLTGGQGFLKRTSKKAASVTLSNAVPLAMSAIVVPDFQSKPGAPTVIYCDFDGETVTDPDWIEDNGNKPIVALPVDELTSAQITETLEIVAEDFRPFDVNVTNVRAIFDATPSNKRVMCISTPTETAQPFSGGVALGDSFRNDTVCWNFNIYEAKSAGDTISHEVGHTLDLDHDGDTTPPAEDDGVYYTGHNSESGRWGPIMGGAYEAQVVQWSKGEYTDFMQPESGAPEDELQVIVTHGLQYRNDDYGNTNASAQPLSLGSSLTGVIEKNTDVDVFKVTFTETGRLRLRVVGQAPHPNLDARIKVYNQSGALLATEDTDKINNVLKDLDLSAGDYYIHVDGDSNGNPLATPATGWVKYGSLGKYTVSAFADPPSLAVAIDNFAPITSSGNLPWFGQAAQNYDGVDAAQAGEIAQGQSSVMEITRTTTSVSFRYKVSSLSSGRLRFFIDGQEQFVKSGEVAWTLFEKNNLSNSSHVFKWQFTKSLQPTFENGEEPVSPSSTAWVDQVVFAGDTGYSQWATAEGATQDGTGDGDKDGKKDILEYALLGSPTSGVNEKLVAINTTTNKLNFKRNPLRKDLTYKVEVSDDLTNWSSVASSYEGAAFTTATGITITEVDVPNGNGAKLVTVDFMSGADTRKFARIVVKKN